MKTRYLRIEENGFKNSLYGIELIASRDEDFELIEKFKKGFKIIDASTEKLDKIKIFVKDII